MSEKKIENLIRGFLEAYASGDVEKTLSFFAEDAVWVATEGTFKGKEELERFLTWINQCIPDKKFREAGIGIMVKGNKAVWEGVAEGVTSDGRKAELPGVSVYEFSDDKIQQLWVYEDRLSYAHPVPFFTAVMYASLPHHASWLTQLWFWSAAYIFDIATALISFMFVLPRVKSLHAKLFSYIFFSRIVFGLFTLGCIIATPGYGYGSTPRAEGWDPQPGCAYATFTLMGQVPIFVPLAIGIIGIIYAVGVLFPRRAFKLFKGHFPLDTVKQRFSLLMVTVWLPYIIAGLISHFVWGANLVILALFSLMIPGLYDGARKVSKEER